MTPDEKRQLADLLLPGLAWNLTGSELSSWSPSATASGVAATIFLDRLVADLRGRIQRGESFSVAVIPIGSSSRPSNS